MSTDKPKRYRLLKDLIGLKAGQIVTWSDESINHYFSMFRPQLLQDDSWKKVLDTWMQPIPEEIKEPSRIEVTGVVCVGIDEQLEDTFIRYKFKSSQPIQKEKFPAIKQAIEAVLNDDGLEEKIKELLRIANVDSIDPVIDWMKMYFTTELYNKKQMDEQIEKAFNAARVGLSHSRRHAETMLHACLYKTAEHYKQSLSSSPEKKIDSKEVDWERLRNGISIIANWELPATGKFWDEEKTRPTSYETEYGSNGVRDYIKKVASNLLKLFPEPKKEKLPDSKDNGWEIESFSNGKVVWNRFPDGFFRTNPASDIHARRRSEFFDTLNGYYINSAIRLSDKEVFTIGDFITTPFGLGKITKFELNNMYGVPNILTLRYWDNTNSTDNSMTSYPKHGWMKKIRKVTSLNNPSAPQTNNLPIPIDAGFILPSGVNKVVASAVLGNFIFYTIQNKNLLYFFKFSVDTGETRQLEMSPQPIKTNGNEQSKK